MTEEEQTTARHEAGHASAARCKGLAVHLVSRTPSGSGRDRGFVDMGLLDLVENGVDKDTARKVAIALLAGPGSAEQPLPRWPLSSDRVGNDEYFLKAFCDYLELDQKGYEDLVEEMLDLIVSRKFTRLFTAIAAWFEQSPRLDRFMVLKAQELAWL